MLAVKQETVAFEASVNEDLGVYCMASRSSGCGVCVRSRESEVRSQKSGVGIVALGVLREACGVRVVGFGIEALGFGRLLGFE